MSQRKPRTLKFPTELTDLHGTRLRIQLRKLHRQYRKGNFTKPEIYRLGEITIRGSYDELTEKIREYVTDRGLNFADTKEQLQKTLDETLESWHGIVSDM